MKAGSIASILTIASLTISSLAAGVVPGRWEKVDSLIEGTGIIVKMDGGDRIEGEFFSSDAKSITIQTFEQVERDLPKAGVKKIQTIEKTGRNKIWDGALIGAGIGAGAMAITLAASGGFDEQFEGAAAACLLVSAGIGAGIGLGIDAAVGARKTLYLAP